MLLGELIYKYRMDNGKMSLKIFAEKAELSVAYVNQLENNKNPKTNEPITPSLETFVKVANAMHMTIDELFELVDENQPVGLKEIQKTTSTNLDGITNLILPAAHPVPILGTICAGDGIWCEENYQGTFYIDKSIKADLCLEVKGDSMIEAGINNGDYAFIKKTYDYVDGKIYAVRIEDSCEAVLKRIAIQDDSIILSPCNNDYQPMFKKLEDVCIIGECVGTYHNVR